jgi:hypothetical protein
MRGDECGVAVKLLPSCRGGEEEHRSSSPFSALSSQPLDPDLGFQASCCRTTPGVSGECRHRLSRRGGEVMVSPVDKGIANRARWLSTPEAR